jgi:hypothetical protein
VPAREGGWTSAWELGGPDLGAYDWHDPRLTEAGCPSPQQRCGGVCVDTRSSVAHCGSCDHACASGDRCLKGVCKPPGLANWTGCTIDDDCASLVCGCNGGALTSKQCLPSALYPRDCGWANWTSCTVDSDCASHWCGCNGGKLKQCLPSTLYPKTCS